MIKIGKKFSTSVIISRNIIDEFSKFSGDYNPIHLDEKEAKNMDLTSQLHMEP